MLTFFSLPKPFRGHIGIIQQNAIRSWLHLRPGNDIILYGDEEGTADFACEFGLCHVPDLKRNEYGTPLIGSMFRNAQTRAQHPYLCYINADILLFPDFLEALRIV